MNHDTAFHLSRYLVPLLVIGLVALRLIRNKPRKVKPNRLFLMPGFLTLVTAFTLRQTAASGLLWVLIYLAAAVVGGFIGYLNGRHREFALDTEKGEIVSRVTPVGTIIFAVLFALRFGLKYAFPELNGGGTPYGPPAAMGAHPAASVIGWTDAGLVFSTAMLLSSAATTWWRTRHLAAERQKIPGKVGDSPPSG